MIIRVGDKKYEVICFFNDTKKVDDEVIRAVLVAIKETVEVLTFDCEKAGVYTAFKECKMEVLKKVLSATFTNYRIVEIAQDPLIYDF